jgi:IclR family acetate operon transcriptional repressor
MTGEGGWSILIGLARTSQKTSSKVKGGKELATNSLERALVILERVAAQKGGLTNKDLSAELGIATSTCSYILERLERNGFLTRDAATGRYSIGLKAIVIARGALRQFDFHKDADPVLRRFAERTGLEAVVGVLDQSQLMIISRVPTGKFPKADVDTGTEFPAHTTAIGKVLLAHLPPNEVAAMIEPHGLTARTKRTIVDKTQLIEELVAVREQGFGITDEEHAVGMRSVAVPITDPWDRVDAAMAAIGTLKDLVWKQHLEDTVRVLREAAREISALRRAPGQLRSTY